MFCSTNSWSRFWRGSIMWYATRLGFRATDSVSSSISWCSWNSSPLRVALPIPWNRSWYGLSSPSTLDCVSCSFRILQVLLGLLGSLSRLFRQSSPCPILLGLFVRVKVRCWFPLERYITGACVMRISFSMVTMHSPLTSLLFQCI